MTPPPTKTSPRYSSIDEVLALAAKGEMFILVDDAKPDAKPDAKHSQASSGDLCVLAEFATADTINFMSKHARGMICLALDQNRSEALGLNLPTRQYDESRDTAITLSLDAREGITTGISARDRAHTIAVAADPKYGPSDITTPGHLFPLIAKQGGTLVRAGRTEAIIDIAAAANSWHAGVLCHIMGEDGQLANHHHLHHLASTHNLPLCTIADLIAWKRQRETIIKRQAEMILHSKIGGDWRLLLYINKASYAEHIALIKGDLTSPDPVLVRMHALNIMTDVLGETMADRTGSEVQNAMRMIAAEGRGVVVILREPSPTTLSDLIARKLAGDAASRPEVRNYGVGAQILNDLGIDRMVLLSNAKRVVVGLDGYGLSIVGYKKFDEGGENG